MSTSEFVRGREHCYPLPVIGQRSHDWTQTTRRGNSVAEPNKLEQYEVVYIIRPNLDEEGVDKSVAQVEEYMKNQGCVIESTEKKGRKRLAYEVKKMRDGYYVHTVFKAPTQSIAQIKRMMGLSEDVIRNLIVQLPKAALLAPPPAQI